MPCLVPFSDISCSSWRPNVAPMQPSTAPGSRPEMLSVGERAVCPGWRILAGETARGGMKGSMQKVDGLSGRIHGPGEVIPLFFDFYVGLLDAVRVLRTC